MKYINSKYMGFKTELLKNLIPPLFLKMYRSKYLKGRYFNWKSAQKQASGYDDDLILEKVKDSLEKVKNGEKAYERDSVLFDDIQYSWPLLSLLLWIATKNDNKLNVIDFGGSLGSSFFQNINFLKQLKELRWNIVEQKKFTDCGKKYFQNDNLKFYYSLADCCKENESQVVLLSGVLQYLEQPYKLLDQISEFGIKYIIIDRTPLHNKDDDFISIQKVPAKIYKASYPCWLFGRKKLFKYIDKNYNALVEFDSLDNLSLRGININYKGFLLERKK